MKRDFHLFLRIKEGKRDRKVKILKETGIKIEKMWDRNR